MIHQLHRLITASFCLSTMLPICRSAVLSAQEPARDEWAFSAEQFLREALLFSADISVIYPSGEERLWETEVNKITIPGRAISVALEGEGGRLEAVFTLYPDEEERLVLAARSQTWFSGDYKSTLMSLPIAYGEKLDYYPLGRAGGDLSENPVEVLIRITVRPYLDTLDEGSRAEMESALDASIRFRLLQEDE